MDRPSDHAALLEAGCTYQLRCDLSVREIVLDATALSGTAGFLLEFE